MKTLSAFACILLLATCCAFAQPATPDADNSVVVPTGTQIKIDLWDHNVAWPVQDGFSVLIPALAKVTFKSTTSQQVIYGDYTGNGTIVLPPQKTVHLISILIGETRYPVEADSVTVPQNQREIVVTLSAPLRISR